jgi:hypothetical protein
VNTDEVTQSENKTLLLKIKSWKGKQSRNLKLIKIVILFSFRFGFKVAQKFRSVTQEFRFVQFRIMTLSFSFRFVSFRFRNFSVFSVSFRSVSFRFTNPANTVNVGVMFHFLKNSHKINGIFSLNNQSSRSKKVYVTATQTLCLKTVTGILCCQNTNFGVR